MGRLVVYQEAEWLVGIPLVEELDGVVGGEGRAWSVVRVVA